MTTYSFGDIVLVPFPFTDDGNIHIEKYGRRNLCMIILTDIRTTLSKQKADLKRRYRLKQIGVFGSFARNEQKDSSDIDILVQYDEVPDLFKFIDLELELEDILKHKVDLVRREAVRPELKDIIEKEVMFV
jgi:predicted nucleotidyltransferase